MTTVSKRHVTAHSTSGCWWCQLSMLYQNKHAEVYIQKWQPHACWTTAPVLSKDKDLLIVGLVLIACKIIAFSHLNAHCIFYNCVIMCSYYACAYCLAHDCLLIFASFNKKWHSLLKIKTGPTVYQDPLIKSYMHHADVCYFISK